MRQGDNMQDVQKEKYEDLAKALKGGRDKSKQIAEENKKKQGQNKQQKYICPECGKELIWMRKNGDRNAMYQHNMTQKCKAKYSIRELEDLEAKKEVSEKEQTNKHQQKNGDSSEKKQKSEKDIEETKKIGETKDFEGNNSKKEEERSQREINKERTEEKKEPPIYMTLTREQYRQIEGDDISLKTLLRKANLALGNVDIYAFDIAEEQKPPVAEISEEKKRNFLAQISKRKENVSTKRGEDEDMKRRIKVTDGKLSPIEKIYSPKELEAMERKKKLCEGEGIYISYQGKNVHIPYEILKSGLSIGRSEKADIKIENKTISSFHAKISLDDGYIYYKDESTNGSWVVEDGIKKKLEKNKEIRISKNSKLILSNEEVEINAQES